MHEFRSGRAESREAFTVKPVRGQQFADLPLHRKLAFAHNGDVFAKRFHFAQQMRINKNRHTFRGQPVRECRESRGGRPDRRHPSARPE